MSAAPMGRAHAPRRTIALWSGWAALAVVAFVVVPPLLMPVTRNDVDLPSRARQGVTAMWSGDSADPSPSLQALLDGWRDYHLVKALFAALALAALGRLTLALWRSWSAHPGPIRRLLRLLAGGASAALALFAALLVLANIQGALAPLASLVSLLPPVDGTSGTAVGDGYGQALAALSADLAAANPGEHATAASAATAATVEDFASFHLSLAVMAGLLAVGLCGAAGALWRRRAARRGSGDAVAHREGRALTGMAGSAVCLALALLVIAAANVGTARAPIPALLSFIEGLRGVG